jgi:FixJ family two-component response regulator
MNRPAPAIYVVDDEPAVLKAVGRLLRAANFNVITLSSSREFLAKYDHAAHGCIVLDIEMPDLNGLDLQRTLGAEGMGLPIIFLTGHGDIPKTVQAIKQGAVDFLTKPVDERVLIDAVRAAIAKDQVYWQARIEIAEINRRLATLTPREHEVLRHVISGRLNKQTAAELGTVEQTIKVHRGRVMEKLNVESLAELVKLAERAGIRAVPPPVD